MTIKIILTNIYEENYYRSFKSFDFYLIKSRHIISMSISSLTKEMF